MNYLYFTATCSVAVGALVICRCFSVFSHQSQSVAWRLLLIRFPFPFVKIPSPVSVFNWTAPSVERSLIYAEYTGEMTSVNPASVAAVQSTNIFLPLIKIGLGAAVLVFMVIAFRCGRLILGSVPCEDAAGKEWLKNFPQKIEIRWAGRIASPMSFGIFGKRYVLVPDGFHFTESTKGIFEHEIFHLKSHDTLWKTLSLMMVCLCWFNPVVWLFYWYIQTEMELLCDEKVLNAHPPEYREIYAYLLIDTPANENTVDAPVLSRFGSHKFLNKRVFCVMKHRKRSAFQWISASIVSTLVVLSVSTNSLVYGTGRLPFDMEMPMASLSDEEGKHTGSFKETYVSMFQGKSYQHDIGCGETAIYDNGGKRWNFEEGQKAVIQLLIIDRSGFLVGQVIELGFICGDQKTSIICEQVKGGVEVDFTAPKSGEYVFYVESNSSDMILVDFFTVKQ